jgi:hypothetical protein
MEIPVAPQPVSPLDIPELRALILLHVPVDAGSFNPALLRTSRAFCADLRPRFARELDLTVWERRWAFVVACERHDALAPLAEDVRHLRIGVEDWKRLRPYKAHPDGSADKTLNQRLQAQLARYPCLQSNVVALDMHVEPRSPESSCWDSSDEETRSGAANVAILNNQRDVDETLGNEAGHVVSILERLRGLHIVRMSGEIDTRLCGAILCSGELSGHVILEVPARLFLDEPAWTDAAVVKAVRLDATQAGDTAAGQPPLSRSLMRWLLYNLRHSYDICRTLEFGLGFADLIRRSPIAERRTYALAQALATAKEETLGARVVFPPEAVDLGECIAADLATHGLDALIAQWRWENRM